MSENKSKVSWTELFLGLKRDSKMVEKKINAHRLAFALYSRSEDDIRAIQKLARELNYVDGQLKSDLKDLFEYIREIEDELKES